MRICDRCGSNLGVNHVGWSFRTLAIVDGKQHVREMIQHEADLCGQCVEFMRAYGLHRAILSFLKAGNEWLLKKGNLDPVLEEKIDAALRDEPRGIETPIAEQTLAAIATLNPMEDF